MRGLLLILCFQFAGNALQSGLALPVPGAILGMLLFFGYLVLTRGGFQPERHAAGQLLRYLPMLYIPAGVGIMTFGPLLLRDAWAILLALGLGTLLAMIFTGRLMQALLNRQERLKPTDEHA